MSNTYTLSILALYYQHVKVKRLGHISQTLRKRAYMRKYHVLSFEVLFTLMVPGILVSSQFFQVLAYNTSCPVFTISCRWYGGGALSICSSNLLGVGEPAVDSNIWIGIAASS